LRQRLFKMIFHSSMAVFTISCVILAVWMYLTVDEVSVAQLFTPILVVAVLAVGISLLMALAVSRGATKTFEKIDLSRPDERDVEEEIKPLVRRLADQNKQIRSQMEQLAVEHERQDQMRRDFTANVSHELKTPLTSISGFAELMRDGMVRPEDVPRFAGKIYDEARRLITLVGDIIRLSQLEDTSWPQTRIPVSLYEMAEQVRQQLLPAAEKMGVTMELYGCEGQVMAAPQVVEEILFNLCDNAIKYNRPGGSVKIEVAERTLSTAVTVTDTGIGIPTAEQARIFERFYRVDKSHSREVGGTGLGLSIVKHGAAALGAQIELVSQVGNGTSISVSFPKETREEGRHDHL